jgi:drug/metabolite transporter (DMT)-like permease
VPIALALAAALVYGASDFLGGVASRRTSTISVVIWSQGLGLILLAIAVPIAGGHAFASDVEWGALCGVSGAVAIALLYRGLAIGTMGVVSPISAVLGAAIPLIFGIALRGERPTWFAYAGIAAALLAIVCVSAAGRAGAQGVLEAMGAGVAFGAFFITLAQTRPEAGMIPLLAARVTSLVLLAGGGLAFAGTASVRVARRALPLVLLCGTLDMSANILYILAAHHGLLALVAVLTSLYPAATVALAAIFLREHLGRLQWAGVALALGGAAAIAGGS